jgi:hypothetical protein
MLPAVSSKSVEVEHCLSYLQYLPITRKAVRISMTPSSGFPPAVPPLLSPDHGNCDNAINPHIPDAIGAHTDKKGAAV